MDKIWTIIKREYTTRVWNKKFLMLTFLTPLLMAIFIAVVAKLTTYQGDNETDIVIVDEGNILNNKLRDSKNMFFTFSQKSVDELLRDEEKSFDAILHIPKIEDFEKKDFKIQLYSDKALNFETSLALEDMVADKIREYKLKAFNLDEAQIELLSTRVNIGNKPFDPSNDKSVSKEGEFINSGFGIAVGYFIGFVLFMMIMINGTLVYQSVMEEKTNRIVEVMVSTVRPFQLMIGKIIGTAGVGITQFVIWSLFVPLIYFGLVFFLGIDMEALNQANSTEQLQAMGVTDVEEIVFEVQKQMAAINWWKVFFVSLIFFICGYLMYSSLFAAVGALAGDDLQQASQMTLPITMPIIFGFYILMATVRTPDSSLAFWSSLFPLFSPIIMPSMSFNDIPIWHILLSAIILIGFTGLVIWFAAKVYRIGILLYGKQLNFKEVFKHLRHRSV